MMRKALETNPKLSQEDASDLIQRCLKVLYYRDCRSLNNVRTTDVGCVSTRPGFYGWGGRRKL